VQAAGIERPEGIPELASWGRRLGAYLIDQLLLAVPVGIGIGLIAAAPDNSGLSVVGVVVTLAGVILGPAIYYTTLRGSSGQTVAKRWLGLRVVDAQTGAAIGYGRAFGRWLLFFVLNLLCGILSLLDGLWPLWDAQNRTWHDKAVSTVVVRLLD